MPWEDVHVKHPVLVTYTRLHHYVLDSTQTSSVGQEKVTLRFRQLIIHSKVFELALKIAMHNHCL